MGIENSKRWHWVLVSLVVGPMLAFMNGQREIEAGMRSISGAEFEHEIAAKEVPGGNPNLKDVLVHPAKAAVYGKPVYVLTMQRAIFETDKKGWTYEPYAMEAEVPYISFATSRHRTGKPIPADPNRTIVSALSEMAAKNPEIHYRYAWWEEPRWSYAIWTGGALAVIGGIWPTVLSLLVGAGFGPKVKEKEYDLDRFGKSEAGEEEDPTVKPEKKEMSDDDKANLAAQLDKLEKNIGTAAVMTDVPAPGNAQTDNGPVPIRQLSGGPVEVAAVAKEEENKEYKGEFYPVAKSGAGKG